jgi:drug/metabolite transporter (DMT)-like permease
MTGYDQAVYWGLAGALCSAVCCGVASAMQAVAVRANGDVEHGFDPRFLLRLLGQWRYLGALALNLVGLLAQVGALRSLPLFVAQATQSAAIPVTAVVSVWWFGLRMRRVEWAAVGLVCVGLSLLGVASQGAGSGHPGVAFHWALLVATGVLTLFGLAVDRLPDRSRSALLGLISGLGFGAVGIAIRVVPGFGPGALAGDPAAYAIVVAGVSATWCYAAALQRGDVIAPTTMLLIGTTVPAALIGELMLGDQARPGWAPVAFIGFVIAVASALTLARFGQIEVPERSSAQVRA